jgi:vancomycin permeability regulator SanA
MIVARFPRVFCSTSAILVTDVIKAAFILFSLVRCECGGTRLMRISRLLTFLFLLFIAIRVVSLAARFLVIDSPEKADAIIVLAGETKVRPARALQLLRQGTAPHVFLDAETRDLLYDQRLIDIAQKYVDGTGEGSRMSVCPIEGFSTIAEADDVARCLQPLSVHRVLIVTSDYHTRRALMIFRHHLPEYQFSVAAARNPTQFGQEWWTHREWAKTTLDEYMKITWWELVDRWRKPARQNS